MCFNADGSACAADLVDHCSDYVEESKGWWSSRFDAQIIFYDPAGFAEVINGTMAAYEPQPYAVLDIDEFLFLTEIDTMSMYHGTGDQRNYRIGETAYDHKNGLLYITELFGDVDAKPIVHVWRIAQ
jgi:hypothetical protein